ncbi:MAG TPA: SDR family oxidoreductase, partial [Arachidicoccus sp.]
KAEVLEGKKIVIIGGSAGIGLATAKAVAAKGAEVIIVSSNQQRIDNALQVLSIRASGIAVNAGKELQIKGLFEQIGHFDHLVYTAGENLRLNNIADTEITDAKQFFDVRYWGAFAAVKYAVPYIHKSGSIVLTSGIAGVRPNKGWGVAAGITSAMEGFTRAMAVELAPVRVNIVSPGIVKTDLWSVMSEADRENLYIQSANALPLKKVGEADDIALTYVYLMEQAFGTGQCVIVDGGAVLI